MLSKNRKRLKEPQQEIINNEIDACSRDTHGGKAKKLFQHTVHPINTIFTGILQALTVFVNLQGHCREKQLRPDRAAAVFKFLDFKI